jgi:hypothetical protein
MDKKMKDQTEKDYDREQLNTYLRENDQYFTYEKDVNAKVTNLI